MTITFVEHATGQNEREAETMEAKQMPLVKMGVRERELLERHLVECIFEKQKTELNKKQSVAEYNNDIAAVEDEIYAVAKRLRDDDGAPKPKAKAKANG